MNPTWGNTWQPDWHPHVYIPPQPFPPAQPGYWHPGWNTTAAYQHAEGFRSSKYPNLNPILAADTTLLRYDVRNIPKDTIPSSTFYTNCHTPCIGTPTAHVRLICKAFPWTIDVKSTHGSVTCELVWDAIYFGLQEPLADSEWGAAVMNKEQREMILKAAKKREEKDKDKRLKRIDWLGESTLFRGLEKDGDFEKVRLLPGVQGCSETWVIRLSSGL